MHEVRRKFMKAIFGSPKTVFGSGCGFNISRFRVGSGRFLDQDRSSQRDPDLENYPYPVFESLGLRKRY